MARKDELTPKQDAFVREYLIDLNATQAAIRAGYSAKTAHVLAANLLSNVKVQGAIRNGVNARAKRTEITADYVLEVIRDTVERCRQAEPVMDKFGKPTGEYKFDANAVLKGAELLGKHLAMFKDKVEVSGEMDFRDLLRGARKQ